MIFASGQSDGGEHRVRTLTQLGVAQVVFAVEQRQFNIFSGRCPRQQVKALKHKPDLAVSNIRQLIAIKPRDIGIIQNVLTGSRTIEATENVHQG